MAKNPLDQQVVSGGITLLDAGFIAASKVSTEELLGRIGFIGNGTLRSGAIKVGGAVILGMLSKNKWIQYVAGGMLIDGVEDGIAALKKGNFSLSAQSSQNNSKEVVM